MGNRLKGEQKQERDQEACSHPDKRWPGGEGSAAGKQMASDPPAGTNAAAAQPCSETVTEGFLQEVAL